MSQTVEDILLDGFKTLSKDMANIRKEVAVIGERVDNMKKFDFISLAKFAGIAGASLLAGLGLG